MGRLEGKGEGEGGRDIYKKSREKLSERLKKREGNNSKREWDKLGI